MPSTFTQNAYTCGAMDIDRSSISGTESGHIIRQILYQLIISARESTPRASEMNL